MCIKHYHENKGDETIWHDGSLADCPETEFYDFGVVDGKSARMAIGFSFQLPPERDRHKYYRVIENADNLE